MNTLWVFDQAGDRLDRFKIARRRGSKTCFDHIHFQPLQLFRDANLFILGHRCARRLFAISQGGVKYDELVGHAALLWKKIAVIESLLNGFSPALAGLGMSRVLHELWGYGI